MTPRLLGLLDRLVNTMLWLFITGLALLVLPDFLTFVRNLVD